MRLTMKEENAMWKFKKKKNNSDNSAETRSINNPNQINDSVVVPLYIPNLGLQPKEYQISAMLSALEKDFKEFCYDFLTKSNPDEFNSTYVDAVIDRMREDSIKHIDVQRVDHVRLIESTLKSLHDADYKKAKEKLETLKEERDFIKKEIKKLRHICWSGTSLEFEEEV